MTGVAVEARSRPGGEPGTGLPVALSVVAVWLVWAALDGGYWPSLWGPLGIVLVGTTALAVTAGPRDGAHREPARVALLALLALFVGWSFLSMTWADFPAHAWEGSNKTLLSVVALGLFASRRWSPRLLTAVLSAFSLGVAAVGAATLARALTGAEDAFADGRLVGPVGYVNASVALWTAAFWPACYLAASPRVALPLRAVLLASAGLLLQLALLGQSRAWLALLPAAGALALLLARARLRLLLAFALAGGAAAATAPLLVRVRDAALAGSLEAELGRALLAASVSCLVLGAAGATWAALDRRVEPSPRLVRTAGVAVGVLAAVVLAVAGAGAARAIDDPADWLSDRWQDFAHGAYPEDERLGGSLASNRYQHWRIAWAEFRERPLAGNGVDNYYAAYLLRRETPEAEPRYPHSWLLRLLSQVGLVGTALFLAAASLAVALALRARRRLDREDATAAAAATMVFAYWLLHGAVDWFWEIPALAAPALGLLGLAGAVAPGGAGGGAPGRRTPLAAAALAVALVLALSLALPWLAYLHQRAGVAAWRSSPALAYERLERAATLNPLAGEPLLLKGSIALRRGDDATAVDALERALEREPKSWYAWFQLALAAGSRGEFERAGELIARARSLNPRDPVVADAETLIDRREPVDPEQLNERFRELAQLRTGRAGAAEP